MIGPPDIFSFKIFIFVPCPQLPPAMSANRRKRSREEQEVQNVLSPGSNETISDREDNNSPSITAHAIAPQATISKESLKEISNVFSDSLAKVFKAYGIGQEPNDDYDYDCDFDADDDYENFDEGIEQVQELPTGRPSHSVTDDNMFGLDVNEVPDDNNNSDSMPPKLNSSNSLSNPVQVLNPPPNVVEPDKSLPLPLSSRAPTNWYPDSSVLAWACEMVDSCEWTDADRAALEKQFSPEEKYDHLFTAVTPPNGMSQALQAAETKKRDYLFRRAETEEFLFQANKDIVCGFRPLLEVLSNLKDQPGMESNRNLLARVFQCMSSSAVHLSRGRRELGRRFVNLNNAEALFNKAPSHYTFFGSSSVDSAVTQAVSDAKINKDLIVMPKKRRFIPTRSMHPGGKPFYNYNSFQRGFQPFRYNYNLQNSRGNFRGGQRGRGRGRRNRPRQQQQKSTTKTSTQD